MLLRLSFSLFPLKDANTLLIKTDPKYLGRKEKEVGFPAS